jgi:hypothetical protein
MAGRTPLEVKRNSEDASARLLPDNQQRVVQKRRPVTPTREPEGLDERARASKAGTAATLPGLLRLFATCLPVVVDEGLRYADSAVGPGVIGG